MNPLQQMGLQTLKGNLAVELTSFYPQHTWPWAGSQQKMDENKSGGGDGAVQKAEGGCCAEKACGLPSLAPAFSVRDSQRVTVLRHSGDAPDAAARDTGRVYL